MQKRQFLKLLWLLLIGHSKTVCGEKPLEPADPTSTRQKRILVIGAGLAGLAAARELQRHGHDVVVVDARNRIGGRIWTSTKWPDMPVDFGASWIHGVQGNPLSELADDIQAKRITTEYERSITYNTNGDPLDESEERLLSDLRRQTFKVLRNAHSQDADATVLQVLQPMLSEFDKSPQTLRFINFVLSSKIEQEYSGSAAKMSAHWFDDVEEFSGEDVLFAQGFKVITEFLARDLHIELEQVVKEVRWNKSNAQVITQRDSFAADHVIVTLPLGVLQSKGVVFVSELPKHKQNAIARLGMGVLNKCYLRFPNAFWPDDVDWLEHISKEPGLWTQWVSFKKAANMPILLGFIAAERGTEIEEWTDLKIVESAMQSLRTIFGIGIPDPTDYQVTRWGKDPFSLGSYSFNSIGATPKMRDALAAPLEESVFFAGEATDKDYFGTAHGAYLSGLRAANEVLNA